MNKDSKRTRFIVSGSVNSKVTIQDSALLAIDDQAYTCSVETSDAGTCQVALNGKTFAGEVISVKQNQCTVLINGNTYQFNIDSEQVFERKKRLAKTEEVTITQMKAPLPGKVCEVLVNEDMKVTAGDPLLILEAMKMHNEICSPVTGVVTKVYVKSDEPVSGDQLLIELNTAAVVP